MHRLALVVVVNCVAVVVSCPLLAAEAAPASPLRVGEVAYQKVFSDIKGWSASPADCYRIDASAKGSARIVIGPAGAGEKGTAGARDVLGAVEQSKNPAYVIRGKLPLLPRYRGCLMNVSILVAAKDVPEPAKPWEGVRCAFHYTVAGGGGYNDFVHGGYGTFAQREVKMTTRIPADATDISCELGLLGGSGEVTFERITMTVAGLPLASLTPPAKPIYKGHDLDRLRGFNTGLYNLTSSQAISAAIAPLGNDWKSNVVKLWFMVRKDHAKTDRELAEWLPAVEKSLATAQETGQLAVLHVGNEWHVREHGDNDLCYEDPAYADKLVEVFRSIAEHFRGDRRIWGIELLNESVQRLPAAPGCLDYAGLMERCAQAINAVDPQRTIIVQPEQWWGIRGFERMRPIKAKNVVYAVHFYAPFSVSCQGVRAYQDGKKTWQQYTYPGIVGKMKWDKEALRRDLQPARDFQKAYGVHMVVSEFSCIRWAPGDTRERLLSDMIELFEEFGWDWMYHDASGWHGWDISLGSDPWNAKRPSEPTGAETLLRTWFSRNQHPARP